MRLGSLTAVLVMLGAVCARPAIGSAFVTLAQLKAQLNSYSRQSNRTNKDTDARATEAYVLGAADAFQISGALCFTRFPEGVNGDDIVATVAAYLRDHAKDKPVAECLQVGCEASWGVRMALREKFRCVEVP
jgi:hypothetical protein